MKVRVMKRYTKNNPNPYYEIDTWIHLLGPIGYWSTQLRTTDFSYASSVFEDYKHDRRGMRQPKDEVVLIHHE